MSHADAIAIRGLVVSYGAGVPAVSGVDLTLGAGRTLGVVGESGSGKSTLARALVGLAPISGGSIELFGRDLAAMSRAERRRWLPFHVQIIFQDPVASLSPRMTLGRALAEPFRIHGRAVDREAIAALLAALGLPESLSAKYPHQVSGGQARRVAIARALMLKPRFLIADEPTAGLDVSVQGDFLNFMTRIQAQFGLGILFISHNLSVVARTTQELAVLYLGRIVETGDTRAIFAHPRHPYTHALLSAAPTIDPERRKQRVILRGEMASPGNPPGGCRFHPRCPLAAERCRTEEPQLRSEEAGRRFACHFPL